MVRRGQPRHKDHRALARASSPLLVGSSPVWLGTRRAVSLGLAQAVGGERLQYLVDGYLRPAAEPGLAEVARQIVQRLQQQHPIGAQRGRVVLNGIPGQERWQRQFEG